MVCHPPEPEPAPVGDLFIWHKFEHRQTFYFGHGSAHDLLSMDDYRE